MSRLARSPLQALAGMCVHQLLTRPIPDDAPAFVARKGMLRLAMRAARRALQLQWSGQRPTLRTRFDPHWQRVLWIHEGMPQIGDALMDLAPRSLLVEHGLQVDLFAAKHIATLFEHDAWFVRALHRHVDVRIENYDAVIVLSHDRKALALKQTRLAALPWVSLQGFYGGPDFHRARFATQRLADLLDLTLAPEAFARHSAQKLQVTAKAAQQAALDCPATDRICLVLGGVWPARTFHRWPELIAALHARGLRRFMLLGGANGRQLADQLISGAGADVELLDFVGRTTLPGAHALLARSAAVVCADGGLMHLALTGPAPVIAMFNAEIDPSWRLPIQMNGVGFKSPDREVDGLLPDLVADAVSGAVRFASQRAAAPIAGG